MRYLLGQFLASQSLEQVQLPIWSIRFLDEWTTIEAYGLYARITKPGLVL